VSTGDHDGIPMAAGGGASKMAGTSLLIWRPKSPYYTRIAISGDRRDAFQAGKSPASMVTVSDRSHT
jgi:hypothetical protein